MLFGVSAFDPISLTAAALLQMLVTLVSCAAPAHKASLVDPIVALRVD